MNDRSSRSHTIFRWVLSLKIGLVIITNTTNKRINYRIGGFFNYGPKFDSLVDYLPTYSSNGQLSWVIRIVFRNNFR